MVRAVRTAVMPMSGGTIRTSSMRHIRGRGASVLLDGGLGGPGAGSSYSSIDDYINTTNQDPYKHQPSPSLGRGIESMNKKIENLLVKSKRGNPKKEKNINFNL